MDVTPHVFFCFSISLSNKYRFLSLSRQFYQKMKEQHQQHSKIYIFFHEHRKLVLFICTLLIAAASGLSFVAYTVVMGDSRENIEPSFSEIKKITGDIPDNYCDTVGTVRRVLNGKCVSDSPPPPYGVILTRDPAYGLTLLCTATLIHPFFILTAAHCCSELNSETETSASVYLGCNDITATNCQEHEITEFLPWASYEFASHSYFEPPTATDSRVCGKVRDKTTGDIMLARLKKPSSIRLPLVNGFNTPYVLNLQNRENEPVYTVGFGKMSEDGHQRYMLQAVSNLYNKTNSCLQNKIPVSSLQRLYPTLCVFEVSSHITEMQKMNRE
jgi:hypothetical protein